MADVFNFYVRDNRKINFEIAEPIMREDSGVTDFRFHIPKTINGLDMSDWAWWFVFVNAKKEKYSIALELSDDPESPLENNLATYTVDYAMSIKAGSVQFALEAINAGTGGAIDNEWHTLTYETKVKETLQGNQAEYAETESDIISALIQEVRAKMNQVIGGATPAPVRYKAQMTDPNAVYLYIGSEPNEHAGHWYYHNGTTFVSGGVYGTGVVDPTPTQGSSSAVSSGGVYSALQAVEAEIPDIDDTLAQTGQAADAKAVGDAIDSVNDDITDLKQDIIDGRVSISTGGSHTFTGDYFRKGIINTSTGNINGNSTIRVNVNGTNKTLYGMAYSLNGVDIVPLPTTMTSISSTGTVYIFVAAYDKNDTEYTGYIGYYTGSGFEKPVGVIADTQYIDLAALSAEYPEYRFKLMVVDTSTTSPLDIPATALNVSYTEPSEQDYRQLVKTVNNIAPDNSGNIDIDLSSIEDDIADITDDIEDIQSAIAEIGDVTQDIDDLKQDIIDGLVVKSSGGTHTFTSDYFRKGIINPSTGNINGNSTVRVNVDGTNKLLYAMSYSLNGVDVVPLPDTITSISSSGTVYIFISAFDKNDTDYTGYVGYYNGSGFDKPTGLIANLQTIDMSALATAYPEYKFKLMVCDTSVTDPLDIPTTAPKVSYTAQSAEDYRRLVKTVNNIAPDSDGNIEIDAGGTADIASIFRFENGRISENTGNDSGLTDPNCLRSIMHCRIPTEKFTINVKTGYKIKVLFYDSTFTYLSHTDYKSATSADLTEELTMSGAWVRISMWKISGDEISTREGEENLAITYQESNSVAKSDVNVLASEYVTLGMFPTFAVLGDSFAYGSGAVSWVDIVGEKNGIEYTKYASGGSTTRAWLDSASWGLAKMLSDPMKHLYIINFGINDKNAIDRSEEVLGSLADIDLEDYTQNPDTFYGNYGRIISNVKAHSPKARIIVLSIARRTERSMDVHVKAIAEKCGVPFIQLTDDPYFESSLYYSSFYSLHPQAYGYSGMATAIDHLVRKCIIGNLWYFGDWNGVLT